MSNKLDAEEIENQVSYLKFLLSVFGLIILLLFAVLMEMKGDLNNFGESVRVILVGVVVNTVSTLIAFAIGYLMFERLRKAINKLNKDDEQEKALMQRKQQESFSVIRELIQSAPSAVNTRQLIALRNSQILSRHQFDELSKLVTDPTNAISNKR